MSYNSLDNFYKTILSLKEFHHYAIYESKSLPVFEREIYMTIIMNNLREEQQRLQLIRMLNGG